MRLSDLGLELRGGHGEVLAALVPFGALALRRNVALRGRRERGDGNEEASVTTTATIMERMVFFSIS